MSALRAFHASEIPYVFNVVPSTDPRETGYAYTKGDLLLASTMSDYWINFVKTGNPNGGALTRWPAYEIDKEPYLEFGAGSDRQPRISVGSHLLKRELDFLEKALARR
jgi:para-nitrobenzyl esterase